VHPRGRPTSSLGRHRVIYRERQLTIAPRFWKLSDVSDPRGRFTLPDRKGRAMTDNKTGRIITVIRLRDDTQLSDFRVPLPATAEAIKQGCTCPPQPEWPRIAVASDCPVHAMHVPPPA